MKIPPVNPNKYSNGKIYQLYDYTTGNKYIGSTCRTLRKRKTEHASKFNRFNNGRSKKYVTSFNIIKNGNYGIKLIEKYPCENKQQLLLREAFYVKSNTCVNKILPIISKEERKKYEIEYRTNVEVIKKQKALKQRRVRCSCEIEISRGSYTNHLKTLKHKSWIIDNPQTPEGFVFI